LLRAVGLPGLRMAPFPGVPAAFARRCRFGAVAGRGNLGRFLPGCNELTRPQPWI